MPLLSRNFSNIYNAKFDKGKNCAHVLSQIKAQQKAVVVLTNSNQFCIDKDPHLMYLGRIIAQAILK